MLELKLPILLLLISSLCGVTTSTETWRTFAFASSQTPMSEWKLFAWDKLTTVAVFGDGDPDQELLDYAHERDCKVVKLVNIKDQDLDNQAAIDKWMNKTVKDAIKLNLDGANFDFEDPLPAGSARSKALAGLVKKMTVRFHKEIPGSEVSVDVAWKPGCVDGRCYQYKEIAEAADLIFVMGYDVQSQMWGQDSRNCTAMPNSPLHKVSSGLEQYLELGIDPKKIIFGVPWYGYVYPCESMDGYQCRIKSVPFRGCDCSDAAGRQFTYGDIEQMIKKHKAKEQWDYVSQTPSFIFKDRDQWFQVRHDNVYSLAIKYNLAKYKFGLGGVGMWNANNLNYYNEREYRKMWKVLPKGKKMNNSKISDNINIDIVVRNA